MKTEVLKLISILLLIVSCGKLPKDNANLGLLAYLSKLQDGNVSSGDTPKIQSTDFISLNTLSPVVISKNQVLGITFNTTMMIEGCQVTLNGNILETSVTASDDKLTLFFTPATNWTVDIYNGILLDLSSGCKSVGNKNYVPEKGATVYIADTITHIDSVNGDDANSGSKTSPFKTVLTGINAASTNCGTQTCAVLLKGGNYVISASISMPTNVSIFGGFDPSDWKNRRADKTLLSPFDTFLVDAATNVTGTGANSYGTLKYFNYSGTKEKTILDGIIIGGAETATAGSFVSPLTIVDLQSGASITIRNSVFSDRSSSMSVTSAGFVSSNNSGTIELTNSSFIASSIVATSTTRHGVVYNGSSNTSKLSLTNSGIDAGISTVNTSGFFSTGTVNGTLELSKNTIAARDCTGCDSIGITASFATINGMTISENTILTGSGNNSYGIHFTTGTGLVMNSNTIISGAGSIFSGGIVASPSSVNSTISNNKILSGTSFGGSSGIVISSSTGTHTISSNTVGSGECTGASCVSSALRIASSPSLVVNSNTLGGGVCSGTTCFTAGVYILGNTTSHTFTGNTIGGGSCSTANCRSIGIYDNSQANLTFSGNTIATGMCSGSSCETEGYYLSHTFSSLSNTVTFSNNTITSGNCTGTSCKTFGFTTSNSNGATVTYNFTGNTIFSGNATFQTAGINVSYNNATLVLTANTISSGSAPTTWGINNAFSSSITLTSNTISVGSCTGACPQIGVRQAFNPGLVTINGNTIDSGVSLGTSVTRSALHLENWAGANTNVQRNTFLNSSGPGNLTAVKIFPQTNKSFKFCSNVLIGGGRTDAGSATTLEIGQVPDIGTGVIIHGNTIIGANVNSGLAVPILFPTFGTRTNLSLSQNIIHGHPSSVPSTTLIKTVGVPVNYLALARNNVSSGTILYDRNGILFDFLCPGNGNFYVGSCGGAFLGTPIGQNNNILNPVFVNFASNDFHLDPSTPTGISQIMDAAELATFTTACGNSLDRDGNIRTAGSAIGAYK